MQDGWRKHILSVKYDVWNHSKKKTYDVWRDSWDPPRSRPGQSSLWTGILSVKAVFDSMVCYRVALGDRVDFGLIFGWEILLGLPNFLNSSDLLVMARP